MIQWLYTWWMRVHGYRRFTIASSEVKLHGWAERIDDGQRSTYRGVADDGRYVEIVCYNPERSVESGR